MRIEGDFHRNGYALIDGLLPPELAQAFMERMEADLAAQNLSYESFATSHPLTDDATVEIVGTSYPPMQTLFWGLTPAMSQLTGRDLLPSFTYFRVYREGDKCRVHSDRPACEYSLSLTLAYSDGKVWPLDVGTGRVEGPGGLAADFGSEAHISLAMKPGDAVLYQGVYHRHGRTAPNPNRSSAHLFLHWVDREGAYKDHAFDAVQRAEAARIGEAAGLGAVAR